MKLSCDVKAKPCVLPEKAKQRHRKSRTAANWRGTGLYRQAECVPDDDHVLEGKQTARSKMQRLTKSAAVMMVVPGKVKPGSPMELGTKATKVARMTLKVPMASSQKDALLADWVGLV